MEEFKQEREELMEQMASLQEENSRYLEKIVRTSKENADLNLSRTAHYPSHEYVRILISHLRALIATTITTVKSMTPQIRMEPASLLSHMLVISHQAMTHSLRPTRPWLGPIM